MPICAFNSDENTQTIHTLYWTIVYRRNGTENISENHQWKIISLNWDARSTDTYTFSPVEHVLNVFDFETRCKHISMYELCGFLFYFFVLFCSLQTFSIWHVEKRTFSVQNTILAKKFILVSCLIFVLNTWNICIFMECLCWVVAMPPHRTI